MSRISEIKKLLSQKLNLSFIELEDFSASHASHSQNKGGDETHLKLTIKKDDFKGLSRIEIHKKINSVVTDEFEKGLHALTIEIK